MASEKILDLALNQTVSVSVGISGDFPEKISEVPGKSGKRAESQRTIDFFEILENSTFGRFV